MRLTAYGLFPVDSDLPKKGIISGKVQNRQTGKPLGFRFILCEVIEVNAQRAQRHVFEFPKII